MDKRLKNKNKNKTLEVKLRIFKCGDNMQIIDLLKVIFYNTGSLFGHSYFFLSFKI